MSRSTVKIVAAILIAGWLAPHALAQDATPPSPTAPTDTVGQFLARVLGSTEDRWGAVFTQDGQQYRAPKLVLYTGRTVSGCGEMIAAEGPRYCEHDEKLYLDTVFFGAQSAEDCAKVTGCELARAIVLARGVGTHVQRLLGILHKASAVQQDRPAADAMALQRAVELQADCLAGVWLNQANRVAQVSEAEEIEPGLDMMAMMYAPLANASQRFGTVEERKRWFRAGLQDGKIADCNTFASGSR